MSSTPPVSLDRKGAIAIITLDRPERRNSLGTAFSTTLLAVFDKALEDAELGAIILTGRGSVFCSGGDIREIMSTDPRPIEQDFELVLGFNRAVARIRGCPIPVVGAINGPAVGGGAALAMACDFALASPGATYDFLFDRAGLSSADMGCAFMLARAVGPMRASRILFTGASLAADELVALGLVTEVVPVHALLARALEVAERVAAGPLWATKATKLALRRSEAIDFETAIEYEAYVQSAIMASAEHKRRLQGLLDQMARAKK